MNRRYSNGVKKDRSIAKHMSNLIQTIIDVGINRAELSRLCGYDHNAIGNYVAENTLPNKRMREIAQELRQRWEDVNFEKLDSEMITNSTRQLLISQSKLAKEMGVSKQLLNQYISESRVRQMREILKTKQHQILKATSFISE